VNSQREKEERERQRETERDREEKRDRERARERDDTNCGAKMTRNGRKQWGNRLFLHLLIFNAILLRAAFAKKPSAIL
jgi:hypothetical protein